MAFFLSNLFSVVWSKFWRRKWIWFTFAVINSIWKGSSLLKGDRKRKSRGNKIHLEFWLNQSYFSVKKSRQQSMSQDEDGVYSKRKMRARQCRKVSWVKIPVHTFMAWRRRNWSTLTPRLVLIDRQKNLRYFQCFNSIRDCRVGFQIFIN